MLEHTCGNHVPRDEECRLLQIYNSNTRHLKLVCRSLPFQCLNTCLGKSLTSGTYVLGYKLHGALEQNAGHSSIPLSEHGLI